MKKNIAVLGAGSWGVTLANVLYHNGHHVSLWEFSKIQARQLCDKRRLPVIPNIRIPEKIIITDNLGHACRRSDVLLFAVPSSYMRSTLEQMKKAGIEPMHALVVTATKGIEIKTFLRMSQLIEEILPKLKNDIVVLSGPSHAEEVSRQLPAAIVAASKNTVLAGLTQKLFMSNYFRIYTNTDLVGVEIGGAFKNILAIGCGISDGLGLGDNAKSALITRGLAEMIRFGEYFGARKETFSGLAGIGDLVVTCTSRHSRNRLLGEKIGKGLNIENALQEMVMVAEGYPTAQAVYEQSKQIRIELPITEQVYAVLYKHKNPHKAITDLMTRKPKSE